MTLRQLILTIPREISGSRTAGRFDFQKDWALAELLRLHVGESDYMMLFDFHEDVVVVDGAENPQNIDFYQIKTRRSGNWTMTRLLQIPKKQEVGATLSSILAKLYSNKITFPEHTRSLNLVSNAPFSFELAEQGQASTSKSEICATEICEEERATARRRLQLEHRLESEPDFEGFTRFHVTDLSLQDHSSHAEGLLSKYLSTRAPHHRIPVSALYRVLFSEISRRNNHSNIETQFDELLARKALTRAVFEQMLRDAGLVTDPASIWSEIERDLIAEGYAWGSRKRLDAAWRRLHTDRLDPSNAPLRRITTAIRTALADLIGDPPDRLSDFVKQVVQRYHERRTYTLYSEDYICAIALSELYERPELSDADTQSEERDE